MDDETERCITEAMDCGFAVHRALGPGFPESTYRNAFCLELLAQKIPFECEKPFVVKYRDRPVSTHRIDLIVRNRLVIELKAVRVLERVHEAQLLSYLKISELHAGLLMNFGGATLKEGIQRVVSGTV
ncbi:MAG TPA: GxxExxY protein [Vicinamibacterales bacterium]|nr:GxxExxY protein [Vicinamibacterales bacterium]